MKVLLFATRNRGKLAELRELLRDLPLELRGLEGMSVPEVVEDGDTFAANATKKALEVSRATGLPALADDSGLEVDALGGAPGVISARYAGPNATDAENNDKLLAALEGLPASARGARFRSVLALADVRGPLDGEVLRTEGVCEGIILPAPRGTGGFGYDPLFYSPELGASFAQIGVGKKNDLSHRARAMKLMKDKLKDYFQLAKELQKR
jgi:XTP/dITP diphosphohydrolase